MRRRTKLATAFTLIPIAVSGGCTVDAPRAREAAPPTTAAPEVVESSVPGTPAHGSLDSTTTLAPDSLPEATTTTTEPVEQSGGDVQQRPAPTSLATLPARTPATGSASSSALVSWYGSESGSTTANGEAFDGSDLTFAHRSMAFGTLVRFCGPLSCVVARCNDRGPFVGGRSFDLSRAAFAAIAPLGAGVASVTWEVV